MVNLTTTTARSWSREWLVWWRLAFGFRTCSLVSHRRTAMPLLQADVVPCSWNPVPWSYCHSVSGVPAEIPLGWLLTVQRELWASDIACTLAFRSSNVEKMAFESNPRVRRRASRHQFHCRSNLDNISEGFSLLLQHQLPHIWLQAAFDSLK